MCSIAIGHLIEETGEICWNMGMHMLLNIKMSWHM